MSEELFREARRYLAGGVNSPVRAFTHTGVPPVFARRAGGKYLYAEDGRRLTDYCLSWGAVILGHAHPVVGRAVKKALSRGTSFGLPTVAETRLARLIAGVFPSMKKIRFTSSGTEAVMSAVRLARGFTGRSVIVKFDGCYHGHSDSLLVQAGSGVNFLHQASSAGIPADVARHTVSLPFNDAAAFKSTVTERWREIAAVILEPVPGNMGVVLPAAGFLEEIRTLTRRHGILLVFDEVITGFRACPGGAQRLLGVEPDITILGKIIGGGLPVGAFGGREEIMGRLAPEGDVYQAGTLSGNPLSMSAGLAALGALLKRPQKYGSMQELAEELERGLKGVPWLTVNRFAGMFTVFHAPGPVRNLDEARSQNMARFRECYRRLLDAGILFPPSPFEAAFLSWEHAARDIERVIRVFRA